MATKNKGASWVHCGLCGKEYLAPTALAVEVMKTDNIEHYNFVCGECDTHDDYCDFSECFWRGSNVFCGNCEHKANEMDIDEVHIRGI